MLLQFEAPTIACGKVRRVATCGNSAWAFVSGMMLCWGLGSIDVTLGSVLGHVDAVKGLIVYAFVEWLVEAVTAFSKIFPCWYYCITTQ